MPEDGTYTSEHTKDKLQTYPIILDTHILSHIEHFGITTPYILADLTLGDGKNYIKETNEVLEGSIHIEYRLMKFRQLKNWHLVGFETEYKYYKKLITDMLKYDEPERHRIELYNLDNIRARPQLIKYGDYARGLIYCDPSGYFQQGALEILSEDFPNLDILIYSNCASFKRKIKTEHFVRLRSRLSKIQKIYWFVGNCDAKQQWTFIYGTNNPNSIKGIGDLLVPVNSNTGIARFNRINYTAKEIKEARQLVAIV